MYEVSRVVAYGAVTLAWGIGATLSFVMLMALTEPMHAPIRATLGRVWAWARRALSVALGASYGLVWAIVWRTWVAGVLVRDLAITYVHTYRADRGTGRHYRGMGRIRQRAGQHRREVMA